MKRYTKIKSVGICRQQQYVPNRLKKKKNSSMKQLFIFQRGGKLQKEENGYVKRTARSSEINRTNLIRDWAKITDARKVKGIYRERLTAGGKGIIVKNRNEIFGTGVDVARSPSFIFQTVTKKGQMGCSNRRERETERKIGLKRRSRWAERISTADWRFSGSWTLERAICDKLWPSEPSNRRHIASWRLSVHTWKSIRIVF